MKIAIDGTLTITIERLLNLYFNFLLKKVKEQKDVVFLVRREENQMTIGFYAQEFFRRKGYSFNIYSGEDAMEKMAEDADLFIFFRDKRRPTNPPAARNLVLIEK